MLWPMILLQAAAPGQAVSTPPRIFLRGAETRRRCGSSREAGEILVCGHEDEGDRLRPLADDRYAPRALRAETAGPGGSRLSVHTDQAAVGGFVSNRAMVTLRWPFGAAR